METLDTDVIRPYRERQGSWRPDFLVERDIDPSCPNSTVERFQICEINARFCWNGFLHAAHGQQALTDLGAEKRGFWGATDPNKVGYPQLENTPVVDSRC